MARAIVGNVIATVHESGPWSRYRFQWESSSAGQVVYPIDRFIAGDLNKLVSKHSTAGSGTYSISLIDDLDVDALGGLGATLAINSGLTLPMYQTVGSEVRDLIVCNEYAVKITHTVSATYTGVLDVYLKSCSCGASGVSNRRLS